MESPELASAALNSNAMPKLVNPTILRKTAKSAASRHRSTGSFRLERISGGHLVLKTGVIKSGLC